MPLEKSWQERYETGETPWDNNEPDYNLTKIVVSGEVRAGSVLEIGCGTGTNSVWLSMNGFSVTGIDLSKRAIEIARERGSKKGADCNFLAVDFMEDQVEGGPFEFVYDRGCFHCMDSKSARKEFARRVAGYLKPGGHWLSIIGNADGPPADVGPPLLSAKEIVTVVEPLFEIISLRTSCIEVVDIETPRAWRCLLRKRSL
jgi:2-polyprenyl-3-methyl-5-hydroxy-6-metoxy-1,4-benzoquinol methylase